MQRLLSGLPALPTHLQNEKARDLELPYVGAGGEPNTFSDGQLTGWHCTKVTHRPFQFVIPETSKCHRIPSSKGGLWTLGIHEAWAKVFLTVTQWVHRPVPPLLSRLLMHSWNRHSRHWLNTCLRFLSNEEHDEGC